MTGKSSPARLDQATASRPLDASNKDPHSFQSSPANTILDTSKSNKHIINNNAGLWGYNIGDMVRFVSIDPYRLIVSGRVKHFISAFGEHVIGKEIEQALKEGLANTDIQVSEFTVAPQINPESGLPFHEWFIEFENNIDDLAELARKIDHALQQQNSYYFDLIQGQVLKPLIITKIKKNGFQEYMKSIGKLGGQNKLPTLSNDRKIADKLINLKLTN